MDLTMRDRPLPELRILIRRPCCRLCLASRQLEQRVLTNYTPHRQHRRHLTSPETNGARAPTVTVTATGLCLVVAFPPLSHLIPSESQPRRIGDTLSTRRNQLGYP